MNQEYNESGAESKSYADVFAPIINFLIKEISMRKSIAGRSTLFCKYEGTYYNGQNPEETKYLCVGEMFPLTVISSKGGGYGGHRIGEVVWVLCYEDRPYKKLWEYKGVNCFIGIIAFSYLLYRLINSITFPW